MRLVDPRLSGSGRHCGFNSGEEDVGMIVESVSVRLDIFGRDCRWESFGGGSSVGTSSKPNKTSSATLSCFKAL